MNRGEELGLWQQRRGPWSKLALYERIRPNKIPNWKDKVLPFLTGPLTEPPIDVGQFKVMSVYEIVHPSTKDIVRKYKDTLADLAKSPKRGKPELASPGGQLSAALRRVAAVASSPAKQQKSVKVGSGLKWKTIDITGLTGANVMSIPGLAGEHVDLMLGATTHRTHATAVPVVKCEVTAFEDLMLGAPARKFAIEAQVAGEEYQGKPPALYASQKC